MTIQPGTDIGRYHILEQLGEGGMAVVYKAYDTRLETYVAVKVIRSEKFTIENTARALKRFQIEARKMAQLNHPNIVKVMDYGEFEGSPYLVMPFLSGGTLKQKLGKPLAWQEAIRILLPIADALSYAHEKGLVHRDIKPSNILITEGGQPMLSDFGVAKVLESEETLDLTTTGMGVGTPEYIAPEQASGKAVDHRMDIYALGVVLYEMLTGRVPFTADTPMAVIIKQVTEPLPQPRTFAPNLPEEVERVLFKALAKDPKDRYSDMNELASAMSRIQISEKSPGKPVFTEDQIAYPHRNKKRNWLPFFIGAAFILGVISMLFVLKTGFFSKGSNEEPNNDNSGVPEKMMLATAVSQTQGTKPELQSSNDLPALPLNTKLFLTAKIAGVPFFERGSYPGAKEAAQELGYTLEIESPGQPDPGEQIQLIDNAVEKGVDAILVSALDPDAFCPSLQRAMEAGIVVVTWDSDTNCRQLFQNQVNHEEFGRTMTRMMCDILGGPSICSGQVAILSAGKEMSNQNTWIEWALTEMQKPEYSGLQLVTTEYGDDDFEKSYRLTGEVIKTYPDLKGFMCPAAQGIRGAAQFLEDSRLNDQIKVTGYGLPDDLRDYVKNGTIPQFALWSPTDQAYLAVFMAHALLTGKIEGRTGEVISAGRLGEFTIGENGEVLLGPPIIFNASNIDEYNF